MPADRGGFPEREVFEYSRSWMEKERIHFSQDVPVCSQAEESCVARAMQANHGCLVKCTGLYADVWHSEEDNKIHNMINDGNAKLLEMLKFGELPKCGKDLE